MIKLLIKSLDWMIDSLESKLLERLFWVIMSAVVIYFGGAILIAYYID